ASLSGLWVVPHLGWQYMFVIGALPALLALVLRSLLPESPRWLAVHGRKAEAEAAISLIESETQKATGQPPPPVQPVVSTSDKAASWSDLFGPFYLRRTLVVWVIWFAAYFVNYGLSIWLPTLYRTVFKLPLATLRFDYAGDRPARHADLRVDYRSCRAAALVRRLLHGCGVGFGRARALPRADRGAGADLHDYRLSLRQHYQYRRLSLRGRPLSHPRARSGGGRRDGLAAVGIDDRTYSGGNDARRRSAVGFCHVRDRRGGRRRDYRRLRGRNQGARTGGGLALARP